MLQPPTLGNQYNDDHILRSYLSRLLPPETLREIEPSLVEMGRLAGGDLYELQLADRLNEPTLTQWDAWGNRIDKIEVTTMWHVAQRIAAEHGVVATAYEQRQGRFSRVYQCALAYLFTPSTDIYSCPLAMTDGAARTLLISGNKALIDRAVSHLTSRNPETFWTSGQWMTEITGGSDVGSSQTIAHPITQHSVPSAQDSEFYSLHGQKWFASAINSQMALTLARPEGNPPGGRGLALFYLELRDDDGRLRNIQIDRLKDKLGTRKVPTAELTLKGTPAQLVMGPTDGVRNIAPLLNITRLWNGVSSVALMRRALALANDYALKRTAFGSALAEKPLHLDTLEGMQAEFAGAFHLAFFVAELTGKSETGEITDDERMLLRLATSIMKLTTGKQAVAVASELLECFGGAGYVEDTGLPQLLRDSQVLPIWEGTTNVLSLDTLRALADPGATPGSLVEGRPFQLFKSEVTNSLSRVKDDRLMEAAQVARAAMDHAATWLAVTNGPSLEAGARRLALTLGRCLELALLIRHAQWSLDSESDERSTRFAQRLAQSPIDGIAR